MNVLCGIVTYNPDIKRLYENLEAVSKQFEDILIYDNGSNNIDDIEYLAKKINGRVIENPCNRGIAEALKTIMEFAIIENFEWVLSLDQDSVIQTGLLEQYLKYTSYDNIGMMSCGITDRNFIDDNSKEPIEEFMKVDKCITSGSFIRVKAYKKTEGYDANLFIDKVDFDICYSLKEAGYDIVKINYNGLLHEIGHGKNINFLGVQKTIYNHPAWRIYYMARNAIYISRKHKSLNLLIKLLASECRRIILVILYEEDKKEKIYQFFRGIRDGLGYKGLEIK